MLKFLKKLLSPAKEESITDIDITKEKRILTLIIRKHRLFMVTMKDNTERGDKAMKLYNKSKQYLNELI